VRLEKGRGKSYFKRTC